MSNAGFKMSAALKISLHTSQPGSEFTDDPGRGNGAGRGGYVRYFERYDV